MKNSLGFINSEKTIKPQHAVQRLYELTKNQDTFITTVVERTKLPPWGINKGKEGRANNVEVIKKSGEKFYMPKKSGYKLNKGDKITFLTGGGGGYGDPLNRSSNMIKNDIKQGYLSKEYILKNYKNYHFI